MQLLLKSTITSCAAGLFLLYMLMECVVKTATEHACTWFLIPFSYSPCVKRHAQPEGPMHSFRDWALQSYGSTPACLQMGLWVVYEHICMCLDYLIPSLGLCLTLNMMAGKWLIQVSLLNFFSGPPKSARRALCTCSVTLFICLLFFNSQGKSPVTSLAKCIEHMCADALPIKSARIPVIWCCQTRKEPCGCLAPYYVKRC